MPVTPEERAEILRAFNVPSAVVGETEKPKPGEPDAVTLTSREMMENAVRTIMEYRLPSPSQTLLEQLTAEALRNNAPYPVIGVDPAGPVQVTDAREVSIEEPPRRRDPMEIPELRYGAPRSSFMPRYDPRRGGDSYDLGETFRRVVDANPRIFRLEEENAHLKMRIDRLEQLVRELKDHHDRHLALLAEIARGAAERKVNPRPLVIPEEQEVFDGSADRPAATSTAAGTDGPEGGAVGRSDSVHPPVPGGTPAGSENPGDRREEARYGPPPRHLRLSGPHVSWED